MAEEAKRAFEAGKDGDFRGVVENVRGIVFYYLVPSLGLLLLGPVAMAVGRRRRGLNPDEWRFALLCFAGFGLGALAWGLLLFGGPVAKSVIHQGTYLVPLLGICGAVVGLRAVVPRLAIWLLGLNALLCLALYSPSFEPVEGTAFSPTTTLFAALFLLAFVALSFRRSNASLIPSFEKDLANQGQQLFS